MNAFNGTTMVKDRQKYGARAKERWKKVGLERERIGRLWSDLNKLITTTMTFHYPVY
jgi:hypothetical protein